MENTSLRGVWFSKYTLLCLIVMVSFAVQFFIGLFINCRYTHLSQLDWLAGKQSAAQVPGEYVWTGHSSNGFTLMCMQGIKLFCYITFNKSLKAVLISKCRSWTFEWELKALVIIC